MKRVLLASAVVAGCTPRVPLEEVPIEGGTEEQRAVVGAELDDFVRWVGGGRVALTEVFFAPNDATLDGLAVYHGARASIELSPVLSGTQLRQILRHELCHALDRQEGLLDGPEAAFDGIADELIEDASHSLNDDVSQRPTKRARRGEVFANLCESGPLGTAVLAHPCGPQEIDLVDAAQVMRDEVWLGEPDTAFSPRSGWSGTRGSWSAPVAARDLTLLGARQLSHATVLLFPDDPEDSVATAISLDDGSEVPGSDLQDLTMTEILAGYEVEPPVGAPREQPWDPVVSTEVYAVSHDGVTLRLLDGYRAGQLGGEQPPRVLVHDGVQWAVLQGACPTEASSVFLADGVLYLGWADDSAVHWGPVDP